MLDRHVMSGFIIDSYYENTVTGDSAIMSKVIGIDLGTTNSCVSVVENDKPVIVPGADGSMTTPSIVAFTKNGERLVGQAARRQAVTNPDRTIASVKRRMGTEWTTRIDGKEYKPQTISAMIMMQLKKDAEKFLGEEVTEAVITVPAYFNDIQRQATKDAGRIAGLNVKRIINEPTSAALSYGLDHGEPQKVMVYDLGGGTFDVSIIEIGEGIIEVLSTAGDNHLGGEDFDRMLMNYLFFQYEKQKGEDVMNDRVWRARMHAVAESCKLELSVASSSLVEFDNSDFTYSVSRFLFENLNKELFNRTISIVERTLKKAQLSKEQIDNVILVGGSTRIPRIQRLLGERFDNSKICKGINADEAVATGAAIYAAYLSSQQIKQYPSSVLLSLGIELHGGIIEKMIPRGSPIPSYSVLEFTTPTDYQNKILFHIVMGERSLLRNNIVLDTILLEDLPLCRAHEMTIKVKMTVNSNYHLITEVDIPEKVHKVSDIFLGNSVDSAEIPRLIREAEEKAFEDRELVARHTEMSILDCLVEEGHALLNSRNPRMTTDWIQQMNDMLVEIREWMKVNEDADISECQVYAPFLFNKIERGGAYA